MQQLNIYTKHTPNTTGGNCVHPCNKYPTATIGEIVLDDIVAKRILELCKDLPSGVYNDSMEDRGQFLEACEPTKEALLASNIGDALRGIKDGTQVALTIRGLPLDPYLPDAPLKGSAPYDKETYVSEGLLCGLALALGYPSCLLGEKLEQLIHQITPVPGRLEQQSNEGAVDLRNHQDNAPYRDDPKMPYDKFMADWLILTGLQSGSGNTKTFVSPIDEAVKLLKPETLDILFEAKFKTDPPDSFKENMKGSHDNEGPPNHTILSRRDGILESFFDLSSGLRPADPNDQAARQAISDFNDALNKVAQEVKIEPGTAVIFNNRRATHRRNAVAIEENLGQKRWVQRVYVFDHLRVMKEVNGMGPYYGLQWGGGMLRAGPWHKLLDDRILELAGVKGAVVPRGKILV